MEYKRRRGASSGVFAWVPECDGLQGKGGAHGRTRTCDLRFRRRTAVVPRGRCESHSSVVNHVQVQGLCGPPFHSGERPSHSDMGCHRPYLRTVRVHFQTGGTINSSTDRGERASEPEPTPTALCRGVRSG